MSSTRQIAFRPGLVSTIALIWLAAFTSGCGEKVLGDVGPTADGGTGGTGPTADIGTTGDVGMTPDTRTTGDAGPAPDAGPLACGTSSEILVAGMPTGFAICDNVTHRAKQLICPNLLPRAQQPHPPGPGVVENCKSDADCTARPNGHCEYSSGFVGSSWNCAYGCVNDQECGAGSVCQCGDPVGACIATNCTTDADCAAGMLCATGGGDSDLGGCAVRLACQTAADQCKSRTDCKTGGPSSEYCAITSTGRKCRIAPQDSACF